MTKSKEINYILEIEKVKKEADQLMVEKLKEIEDLKIEVQNAEVETALIKATGMNSPEMKAAKARISQLEEDLHSKDYWRDPDYKFLIEENAELQKRIIDLEQEILEVKGDNKKLAQQISIMMERMRDADF